MPNAGKTGGEIAWRGLGRHPARINRVAPAYIEAFNGRFRAEWLNQHWFLTLADATETLEAWRRYYNEEPPYGAIGNNVPIMLTKSGGAASPPP